MIEVKGYNGQVRFDGQYVTITRKGFLARASVGKGEKRLHVGQITDGFGTRAQKRLDGSEISGFVYRKT